MVEGRQLTLPGSLGLAYPLVPGLMYSRSGNSLFASDPFQQAGTTSRRIRQCPWTL